MSEHGRVKPTPDSIAPDPTSDRFEDTAWSYRYGQAPDFYTAEVMDAYRVLVTHSEGVAILQGIRRAVRKAHAERRAAAKRSRHADR